MRKRKRGRGGAKKGHKFFGNQYTQVSRYARGKSKSRNYSKKDFARDERVVARAERLYHQGWLKGSSKVKAKYPGIKNFFKRRKAVRKFSASYHRKNIHLDRIIMADFD